mgnify:CR=1 FL=1
MAKAVKQNYTLKELDIMSIDEAQKLPFSVRDKILDLLLAESKKVGGKQPARQVGLMCDWFEEDIARLQKIKAIKICCGGFIPVDSSGEVPTLDPKGQFKLVFDNVKSTIGKAGSNMNRIVYRKYIKCSPTRAAIGCQDLNKTYQIEIVNLVAYKVAK